MTAATKTTTTSLPFVTLTAPPLEALQGPKTFSASTDGEQLDDRLEEDTTELRASSPAASLQGRVSCVGRVLFAPLLSTRIIIIH